MTSLRDLGGSPHLCFFWLPAGAHCGCMVIGVHSLGPVRHVFQAIELSSFRVQHPTAVLERGPTTLQLERAALHGSELRYEHALSSLAFKRGFPSVQSSGDALTLPRGKLFSYQPPAFHIFVSSMLRVLLLRCREIPSMHLFPPREPH